MKAIIVALVLFGVMTLSPESCRGYRILGVFPVPARSHFMMFEALMKGLALKGHQVDVVSPFPLKKSFPNYTDTIALPAEAHRVVNNVTFEGLVKSTLEMVHYIATEVGNKVCEGLRHPEMLKLIRNPPKDPPYDLVITQVLSAHCFMALGRHLNVPIIGVTASVLYPWGNGIIGNPANLAFVPNNLNDYVAPMTFWQRLHNTVSSIYIDTYFQYHTSPQDDVIKKYFGEEAPGVREVERSLAVILVNSHPALNGPKPTTPALIEVGGLHIQDDGAELPRDLKTWMDDSTEGFVYFTLGSMVLIESFPEEIIRAFYKSFEKIAPIRILMKVRDPEKLLPGLPKNIRTFVWAPQYKVLKHKNTRAYITHGGLLSTQEAVHCAVPMIGMPLFADQFVNVELYTKKNIAVTLHYTEVTEEKMDKALQEILFNPVYKNTIRKVSQQFVDRPMSAMETATWWVEYVARHGSNVLRSPAMDLAWWQIELLDVYSVLLLIAAVAVFTAIWLLRFIINKLSALGRRKVSHSKKAN